MSNKVSPSKFFPTVWRGLRKRCPNCGEGALFASRFALKERCTVCGWDIHKHEENTYFVMYMSTAAITGLFIIAMLICRPTIIWLGSLIVGGAGLLAFVGTHQYRKGVAIAVEHWLSTRT